MVRTQIYLTEEERGGLSVLVESTGKNQAQLIHEAIDLFIELNSGNRQKIILNRAAGMWQNRDDLPDFHAVRRTLDRS